MKASLAQAERELRRRELELERRQAEARLREEEVFASELVRLGVIQAAQMSTCARLLARSDKQDVAEFREEDGSRLWMTDYTALRELLAALPRPVDLVGFAEGSEGLRIMIDPSVDGITRAADALVKWCEDRNKPMAFNKAVHVVSASLNRRVQ